MSGERVARTTIHSAAGFALLAALAVSAFAGAELLTSDGNATTSGRPKATPAVIAVEHVPDQPSRTYRINLANDRLLRHWRETLAPSRVINAGFGPLDADLYVGESLTGWLSIDERPYDGRPTDSVLFTAPYGFKLDRLGPVGTPVWVYEVGGWVPTGTVSAVASNPEWVSEELARYPTPLSRGGRGADPSVVRQALSPIDSVVVRDDDRALIVRGIHGMGERLHSLEVEETPTQVFLSAFVGLEPEFAARLDREENVAVLAIGIAWRVDVVLKRPLGSRQVVSRGGGPPSD